MSPIEQNVTVLAWLVLSTASAGAVVWGLVAHFMVSLNFEELDRHVRRLLSAENRERAVKLAQAGGDRPICRLLERALTGEITAESFPAGAAGYREGSFVPLEMRAQVELMGYAEALWRPFERRWYFALATAVPALLLGVPALRAIVKPDARVWCIVGWAGLLFGVVWQGWMFNRLRGSLREGAMRWARYMRAG